MKYLLILGLIVLAGCQAVVCNEPYMQIGRECCLDGNNNGLCDADEDLGEAPTIIIKEPKILEKEIVKYVCENGTVVTRIEACIVENTEREAVIPTLATANEENTLIEEVAVEPACKAGINGGEIFFKVGTVPSDIAYEIREFDGEYEDYSSHDGLYQRFTSFAICDDCTGKDADFKLNEGTVYVLRLRFNQTVYNRVEYSNEHLIDTRDESIFMKKRCVN
ncbi:hypothetical protein GOV09_02035 [Candidatus Woesearchaeota archaeon]|nr:hypothetical protein [Candidatus Woesearchaeota archaeon]